MSDSSVMEKSLSQEAQAFAEWAHAGQMYGEESYAHSHLPEVGAVLVEFGFDTEVWRARAWLHDVIEDTQTHPDILMDEFGPEITWPVWACTGIGPNRKIRNADIYTKLKVYGEEAQILKLADRIANCRRGGKNDMYRKEYPEFIQAVELAPSVMKCELAKTLNIEYRGNPIYV
jgi:(p)ppGpp synthase/HD superfamily hydrolase